MLYEHLVYSESESEMAEGGSVPALGGYDYEFTSKFSKDLECPVCHLTMKDPVQIVGCGHRLCNICMESVLRCTSPRCPVDRQPLSRDKIFPDAACHRTILDLTVKCPHVGCSWTGELRAVEKHQSECPFMVVSCTNSGCTGKLIKRDLFTHVSFECSWRKIKCKYCQKSIILNKKQEHFGVCPKFPVECTNKCGLREIPREKLDVHVQNECPATDVQCEYKNLGYEGKFPRSNAKSHSKTQVERHLNLALRGLEATQLQVKEQSQQIERLMTTIKGQSQQIERHKQIIESLSSFVWKISNFDNICKTAPTERESKFHLSKYGYKYLLKISVGHGLFRSWQTLELYIKVVPGEFDSLLSWPCKEKVRVTLIDQQLACQSRSRENISRVVDFEKGKNPCSWPLTEDTHEYRLILSLEMLGKLENLLYIKDDTILIMVSQE